MNCVNQRVLLIDPYLKSVYRQERVLLGGAVQNITSGAYHSCGLLLTGEVLGEVLCEKGIPVYPLNSRPTKLNTEMD